MTVVILPFAEARLSSIAEYMIAERGQAFAARLVDRIEERLVELEEFPHLGAVEELLNVPGIEYRRLVEGYYKILYFIVGDEVLIADIFDSRRDPMEMLG